MTAPRAMTSTVCARATQPPSTQFTVVVNLFFVLSPRTRFAWDACERRGVALRLVLLEAERLSRLASAMVRGDIAALKAAEARATALITAARDGACSFARARGSRESAGPRA